jgi:ABC-type uncharacterized transport system ATPase subunit
MTAVIRTEELTKRYRGLLALDHVNLDVQEGAIYALLDPNGAGKTTSIKILMNLITATRGHAAVLGVDSKLIRGKSYTQIGHVSENQQIPEWMKVGALLAYLRDFYPTWDRELEDSLLKQFDLPGDRKIGALSRGMKMKLALASALAFHPKLIVLDEPFGGLDPGVRSTNRRTARARRGVNRVHFLPRSRGNRELCQSRWLLGARRAALFRRDDFARGAFPGSGNNLRGRNPLALSCSGQLAATQSIGRRGAICGKPIYRGQDQR